MFNFITSDIIVVVCFFYLLNMASHKFDLEKFNGSNDLTLWKVKMRVLLNQQRFMETLEGEAKPPKDIGDTMKTNILAKAHSAIFLKYNEKLWVKKVLFSFGRNFVTSMRTI